MSYFSKLRAARQLRRFRRFRENRLIEFLRNPNSNPNDVQQFFFEVNQLFHYLEVGFKKITYGDPIDYNFPTFSALVSGGSRESKTEDDS